MIRQLTVVTLAASVFATGCTMDQKERPVVSYFNTEKVPLEDIPFKGDYTLYQLPRGGNYVQIYRGPLEPPGKIGFQKSADGSLDAIAGNKNVPIEPGYYTWQAKPAPGQFDAKHTGVTTATVVIVVVVAAALIASAVLAF